MKEAYVESFQLEPKTFQVKIKPKRVLSKFFRAKNVSLTDFT